MKPIKVLYVEDDDLDRMIFKRAIKSSEQEIELVFANDMESGKAAAAVDYNCIFLDYSLPDGSGIELLKHIRASGNTSPIIIVTSQGDEKIAVEAMKNGAQDYIPKNLLTAEGLAQSLRFAVRMKENELEKQRIEWELLETQKRLQTVVARSPIILFLLDAEGTFTLFEGKAIEGFGMDPKAFIGKKIEDIAPDMTDLQNDFKEALTGIEKVAVYEVQTKFFETFYTPVFDPNHVLMGVIGVATDITDHKMVEKELTRAKQLAEEAANTKEQFLANMSHEIRTPMNGIIGLTNILMSIQTSEEQMRYLLSMKKCSDNLMIIINDILDLSKIEAGKMTFEKVPFSIEETLNLTCTLYSHKASEKNITLKYEIDKSVPQIIDGDPTRLGQILNNLVSNSIKFTEKGSIDIRCSIIEAKNLKNRTLHFEVRDTGIGISEQSITTVFDSFTQASSDITRKFGGTGLGLSIVKKLVELQNGTVGVKSKLGKGTTFYFQLPFESSKTSEKNFNGFVTSSNKLKHYQTNSIDDALNLHVLIAEDNHINQMVVKKFLSDWGATIDFADNGAIALEKAGKGHYDLILMDIHMPVMDGYTATKKIRSQLPSPFCDVPILAMTASVPTEKDKCMEIGMNDFIVKPFNPDELRITLSKYTANQSKQRKNDSKPGTISNSKVSAAPSKTQEVLKHELNTEDTSSKQVKIDLVYLKQISGNNTAFIMQMIEIFLKNTPLALEEMNEKFKQQNWDELRNIAHKIKSTYTYVGLNDVQKLLAEIERCSLSKTNLETIPDLIGEVETKSKAAFKALELELGHLK